MKDYRIHDDSDEIIISFNKIWDNIVRFWWIIAVSIFISIIIIIPITLLNYQIEVKSMKNNKELNEINIDNLDQYYKAETLIYLKQQEVNILREVNLLKDSLTTIDSKVINSYIKSYIEQWNWNKNEQLLYDCQVLLQSNKVIKQINKELDKVGYKIYDGVTESIYLEIQPNSRFYKLNVKGTNINRIKEIANISTKILLKDSAEILAVDTSQQIDEANVYYCKKEMKNGIETIVEHRISNEKEIDKRILLNNKSKLTLSNFITIKKIVMVILSALIGLGIIFIIIVNDKKIRNRDEFERYFKVPFLGELKKKNNKGMYDVLATTIIEKCKREKIKSILITTPSDNIENDDKVIKKLATLCDENKTDINVIASTGILTNTNAIKLLNNIEGIIIVIHANYDELDKIDYAINQIYTLNENLIGYIIFK